MDGQPDGRTTGADAGEARNPAAHDAAHDAAANDPAANDPACDVAHGAAEGGGTGDRQLVAVYATPLASHLLRWGEELGFHTSLLEPDTTRLEPDRGGPAALASGAATATHTHAGPLPLGPSTDVVVTDHHRDDLGATLAPLVLARPRWIGIIGSPRHVGPHVAALRAQGIDDELIATVRRPIGVDIGSKTPAEIALSVLAGLLADRNGRAAGLPEPPRVEARA